MKRQDRARKVVVGLFAAITVAAPLSGQEVPQWRLQERLRIGSLDGVDALTAVGDVSVGADGRIYVAQFREGHIKVFALNGRLERLVGRPGQGPGEFEQVTAMGWLGDTLYVVDAVARRVTFLNKDLALAGTMPSATPLIGAFLPPSAPVRLAHDGTALAFPTYLAQALLFDPGFSRPVLETDWSGEVRDTIVLIPLEHSAIAISSDKTSFFAVQPFADHPLWAAARDASFLVVVDRRVSTRDGSSYGVRKIMKNGTLAASTSVAYEARRIPSNVRDSVMDAALARIPKRLDHKRDDVAAAMFLPSTFPPVTLAAIGSDQKIWIRRERVTGSSTVRWDVLSPNGVRIAWVEVPQSFMFRESLGSIVWGVETDEFDVPYLVKYDMVR